MFDPVTREAILETARRLDVEAAVLMAVCDVESGGAVLAMVDGRPEPLIRFEGHYFHRLLPGSRRDEAVSAGLASPVAGGIANPRSQVKRWRLLARAMAFGRDAALQSVSWGIGQVMGVHWRWLGYGSIDHFVSEVRRDGAGQVEAMGRFIDKAGLAEALRRRDFAAFARAYNGPAFRKFRYDDRMEQAFRRYQVPDAGKGGGFAAGRHDPLMLRLGSRGEAVRQLQKELGLCGFPVAMDGDFGPATRSAVTAFQERSGIAADGIAGPATFEALQRLLPVGSS